MQLLHRIRLQKFSPQAPLADICVRETDWQTPLTMVLQNIHKIPKTQNTSQFKHPKKTAHPPLALQKIVGEPNGIDHENHENEIPQQIIEHNQSTQKIQKESNNSLDDDIQKTPEYSQNTPVQKEPKITRGDKYNLRPNPNPNYSDTYRY